MEEGRIYYFKCLSGRFLEAFKDLQILPNVDHYGSSDCEWVNCGFSVTELLISMVGRFAPQDDLFGT